MQTIKEPKQPWEILPYGVDFSTNMSDGESIDSALSEVAVYNYSTSEDVTSEMIVEDIFSSDGITLSCVIKGGESGVKYKISFRAYISETKKLEEDLKLSVKD